MGLHQLHPFQDSEIRDLPQTSGVFVLFQIEVPIHVDGVENLRKSLRAAKASFPQASHFSTEILEARALTERVRQLRRELRLVRTTGFGEKR